MGSRLNLENVVSFGLTMMKGTKIGSLVADATAEMAIGVDWPTMLILDPAGGAKTVLLPAEASSKDLIFIIVNAADAAETITVEEDSSTTSIGTVAQNASGLFHCDGVTWRKIVL